MSKPFTLHFLEGVTEAPCKLGWHKRALAAERAAISRGAGVAPQYGRGTQAAESKAVEYAQWLAARDGIALPSGGARVEWAGCRAGMRPRSVVFGAGSERVTIALPHWSYESPEPVAVELLEWTAPVITERPAAIMDEIMEAPAAIMDAAPLVADDIAAALALPYGEPCEAELSGTEDADTPPDLESPVLPASTGINSSSNKALGYDSQSFGTASPGEAIAEPWRPSAQTHPIVALCLSDKAREALEARVLDGTWRAAGRDAAGGAWRLTLDDARACADIPSLRLVGMPRKPRRPRVAPPIEAIAACPPLEKIAAIPAAYMVPGAGRPAGAVTFHSAPTA